MEYTLTATITLDINNFKDASPEDAVASFKRDLETRFDASCENINVTVIRR